MLKKLNDNKNKWQIAIILNICAIILNYSLKYIAATYSLPLWLDSLGTCLIAYLYGPACGAIIGIGVNLGYGLFDHVSLIYAVPSLLVGIIAGFMARKGYFETVYKTSVVGLVLSGVCLILSTPFNMLLFDGYNGNLFGDGIYDMFLEMGLHPLAASMLGEFAIDLPDKLISAFFIYLLIIAKRNQKLRYIVIALFSCILAFFVSHSFIHVYAAGYVPEKSYIERGYANFTTYDASNGLIGGEANAVAFTNDGYIWIGTYSGLYKYDGSHFSISNSDKIRNVNCLFRDEEGRIWIGTNDGGLLVMVDGEIVNHITTEDGLSSNAVNCIGQDNDGNYYIGTKNSLNIIRLSGGILVEKCIPEINYAYSVTNLNDLIVVVDNSGVAYVLKEGEILYSFTCKTEGETFSCALGANNKLYLGTYSDSVHVYRIDEKKPSFQIRDSLGTLKNVRNISFFDNTVWVCADNGIAYLKKDGDFNQVNTGYFNSSIAHIGMDYQQNIWVASTHQGLLKISESSFLNLYKNQNLDSSVVNAAEFWNDRLWVGTDNGIDAFDLYGNHLSEDEFVNTLDEILLSQRVRNLLVDSNNHLWISTTTGLGLLEVDTDGNITYYNAENGTLSNRFRSAIELSDGTIASAQDTGINFIKNGTVTGKLSTEDGLVNSMILSLYEDKDGTIYAGSDGAGMFIIKDRKVIASISQENGLSSGIVLRIVPLNKGLLLITSNGLNYYNFDGSVKYLHKFIYSNNFDAHTDDYGNVWILSSAGIYVVNETHLIADDEYNYSFLNAQDGLNGTITSNSWAALSETGTLYIPCDNGLYLINMNDYHTNFTTYRMMIESLQVGDLEISATEDRTFTIPGGNNTVNIKILIPNYTERSICVGYMLENYDAEETIVPVTDANEFRYSNLPGGEYKLILHLYTDDHSELLETVSYKIIKEARIFDHLAFKLYAFFIYGLFIGIITWTLVKRKNEKIYLEQQKKIARIEHDARVSNETIMAIAKTVDAKDERTSKHSDRVAEYSRMMAKRLGWPESDCDNIYQIGLLHDIGKIGIPDRVLNKPGRLTDEEYAIMKTHVDRGADILQGFTLVKNVDVGARFHHERYDGKGYPQGLSGNDIPIEARIIGIADAFDAMTSNRVYRNRLDINDVLAEMKKCSGTQFDPELIKIFLGLIDDKTINVEALYEK